ncbi:MAG TPA: plastocyanin/azurin family copper-binding protein [Cyclobacteriaceae bacterium]|nr:plastocyanin/azurin family copper-binding protein [Cyclobacteriaceae bacterium]
MTSNQFIRNGSFLPLCLLLTIPVQSEVSPPVDSVTTVLLNAIPGLQYDVVRFTVKPGARVKVILTNKDDMSHNLVFTKPGARLSVVNGALKLEEKGPMMNYIPGSADVLWSIPILSPGQVRSIVFTAPKSQGAYPYVCTFPGHGFVMYGVMYVTTDEHLPGIENDLNIPPTRRESKSAEATGKNEDHTLHSAKTKSPHPYEPTTPYLYRVYMEDASPAAIAVNLPNELSYCWDAGTCQLRYAWQGGFVDNTAVWKGQHKNAVAKILGTIFFRETTHPLRIGSREEIPVVAYKGYQLINRYPEFHYTLDGIDVYELIQSKADGQGLVRTFRIPGVTKPVCIYVHSQEGIEYETPLGKWKKNKLMLSSSEAREFTIVMTKTAK